MIFLVHFLQFLSHNDPCMEMVDIATIMLIHRPEHGHGNKLELRHESIMYSIPRQICIERNKEKITPHTPEYSYKQHIHKHTTQEQEDE